MVSEANLAWLRQRGALYLVGTPKSQLQQHEAALLDPAHWQAVREGLEVKLVDSPGGQERFIVCRSTDRAAKEAAMLDRQVERLRAQLAKLDTRWRQRQHPTARMETVGRRVGRWLGRYPAAAAVLQVSVEQDRRGRACGLIIQERAERRQWARQAHGAYLLRTNYPTGDPVQLWRWYLQLTQAESAFRKGKSDLHLRPVFTNRPGGWRPISWCAFWLWRSGAVWSNGCGPRGWGIAPANSYWNWMNCVLWMWSCRKRSVGYMARLARRVPAPLVQSAAGSSGFQQRGSRVGTSECFIAGRRRSTSRT
jgi:hypothetical protein